MQFEECCLELPGRLDCLDEVSARRAGEWNCRRYLAASESPLSSFGLDSLPDAQEHDGSEVSPGSISSSSAVDESEVYENRLGVIAVGDRCGRISLPESANAWRSLYEAFGVMGEECGEYFEPYVPIEGEVGSSGLFVSLRRQAWEQ
jgi:hypothetical protein